MLNTVSADTQTIEEFGGKITRRLLVTLPVAASINAVAEKVKACCVGPTEEMLTQLLEHLILDHLDEKTNMCEANHQPSEILDVFKYLANPESVPWVKNVTIKKLVLDTFITTDGRRLHGFSAILEVSRDMTARGTSKNTTLLVKEAVAVFLRPTEAVNAGVSKSTAFIMRGVNNNRPVADIIRVIGLPQERLSETYNLRRLLEKGIVAVSRQGNLESDPKYQQLFKNIFRKNQRTLLTKFQEFIDKYKDNCRRPRNSAPITTLSIEQLEARRRQLEGESERGWGIPRVVANWSMALDNFPQPKLTEIAKTVSGISPDTVGIELDVPVAEMRPERITIEPEINNNIPRTSESDSGLLPIGGLLLALAMGVLTLKSGKRTNKTLGKA